MSLIELAEVWPFDAIVKAFSHALPFLVVGGGFSEQAVIAGIGVGLGLLPFEDFPHVHGNLQTKEDNKYHSHGKPYRGKGHPPTRTENFCHDSEDYTKGIDKVVVGFHNLDRMQFLRVWYSFSVAG